MDEAQDSRSGSTESESSTIAVSSLISLLEDTGAVIEQLTEKAYREKMHHFFGGSIGEHVRHLLGFVQALLSGLEDGVVDYAKRERGTSVETEREAGLERGCPSSC